MKNTEIMKTDHLSFDEAYRLKYKDIYRYCYYNIRYDKSETEDVANDVFVALYEIWDAFDPKEETSVTKWLYKTAHNMVMNHNKMKRRQMNTVDYDDNLLNGCEQIESLSANDISEWEKDESFRIRVDEIKRILSKSQYEIFSLSMIEEYSNAEIAKILGLKENTVKVNLHRIRSKLKRSLKK